MFNAKNKKEKGLFIRSLTVLLAVLITVSMMPAAAFAADGDASEGYVFDTFTEYSTYTSGDTLNDSFYYTDEWFSEDPSIINHSLGLLSMQLTAAAVEDGTDGYGAVLLDKLGFDSVGYEGFGTDDPDDCAYTWARKTLDDGTTLIAIAVQSYAFDSETKAKGWKQNFRINDESSAGEHYALAKAAEKALDSVASLSGGENVKYWITGQSRGGAIANLIAAKLPDKLGSADKGIFAYTFEAPATADAADNGEQYSYIHNYICTNDIVPKVPMWDMVRYGTDFTLNTEEADAGLMDELERLGSDAVEYEFEDHTDTIDSLISQLEARVSAAPDDSGTRADYSKVRNESFTAADGTQVDVEYVYQDIFVKLMNMIFSGELEGLSMEAADEALPQLFPTLDNLKDAVLTEEAGNYSEAAPYYWTSAVTLRGILNALVQEGSISLSDEEVYGLLRLLGPMLINSSYEPTGEPEVDAFIYAEPIFDLVGKVNHFTFSHHFDSIIARLKVLAPQPDLDDIDITVEDPSVGDASSKLPGEAADFIDAMGHSWLLCETELDTEDSTLQDGKLYYLNVTLEAKGHLVTDEFGLTVNGEAPVLGPDITYEDGVSKINAVFEFILGDPEEFTVSFDNNGHGDTPEAITVQNGKSLAVVDKPEYADEVSEGDKTWLFGGWFDEDGNSWDDIIVTEDMTLYAKWDPVIDNIEITFDIPSVGDDVPELRVPDGAPYFIVYSDDEEDLYSTYFSYDYEPVSSIDQEGTYDIYGYISIKDGAFKIEIDEYDLLEYAGTITVNGEEVDASYEFDNGIHYIYFSYEFEVTSEDQTDEPDYKVVSGSGQTYVTGSGNDAEFIIKRTVNDSETFSHFTGIEIDGTAVDASDYTAEEGSVVITLKADYLDTLDTGEHVLKVLFDDGSAEAKFTVTDKENDPVDGADTDDSENKPGDADKEQSDENPKTGDETNIFIWIALMLVSSGVLGGTVFTAIRRRQ